MAVEGESGPDPVVCIAISPLRQMFRHLGRAQFRPHQVLVDLPELAV